MVTAVTDRSMVTLELVKIKLRIDGSEDDQLLTLLLTGAKRNADVFLNNPFQDETGSKLAIPEGVEVWVLGLVERLYEQRGNGVVAESTSGLGAINYGEIDYALLWPFRFMPSGI